MKIAELRKYRISPFEIEDEKLRGLFAFFLHKAPTINSKIALKISPSQLQMNWDKFIGESEFKYRFYSPGYFPDNDVIKTFGLSDELELDRRHRAFICTKASIDETDYTCILRHTRNALAHGHVYVDVGANRKYILIEDLNQNNKLRALMLFTQTDMKKLKTMISQEK